MYRPIISQTLILRHSKGLMNVLKEQLLHRFGATLTKILCLKGCVGKETGKKERGGEEGEKER